MYLFRTGDIALDMFRHRFAVDRDGFTLQDLTSGKQITFAILKCRPVGSKLEFKAFRHQKTFEASKAFGMIGRDVDPF